MNIGFYLLDIAQDNQVHTNILKSINKLCEARPYDNIVLFNNRFNTIDLDKKYYILHISEAKYFRGILFLFDLKSLTLSKTFPGPDKQVLFISKPDWSQNTKLPYSMWHNIYMQNNLELISTNDTIDNLCKICWKDPIAKIENYNHEGIDNVLQKL